eukprot:m.291840 g.291840  ORF g.291840 m.291840 type:complete len:809 (-) comp16232_c0_seq5:41-2467(-)
MTTRASAVVYQPAVPPQPIALPLPTAASVARETPQPAPTPAASAAPQSKKGKGKAREPGAGRLSKKKRVTTTVSTLRACVDDSHMLDRLQPFRRQSKLAGTIMSGDSVNGWHVKWDILGPDEPNTILVDGKRLTLGDVAQDDGDDDDDEDFDDLPQKDTGKNTATLFPDMSPAGLRAATECKVVYGKKDGEHLTWVIHRDGDRPSLGETPSADDVAPEIVDIDWSRPLHEIFFEYVFPDLDGHGALMDQWLSDKRCKWKSTYDDCGFKFDQVGDADRDWFVKQCYLILIAGPTEVEVGVEGLWSKGKGDGRRPLPDFGRYVQKNVFKMFKAAAIFAFAPKEMWFTTTLTWGVFEPVLAKVHERRRGLFKAIFALLLDETMVGWRPKNKETGGLPNITHEPRKPVSLGTMLRDACEPATGVLTYFQVVKDPVLMKQLPLFNMETSLPDKKRTGTSVSECLRAAEGVFGPKCDGAPIRWVGGDAWFGSVTTAVELKTRLGVDSTFIVKNNTRFFPKEQLRLILDARHNDQRGQWAVMSTEVGGVKLMAIAYAWSTKGTSYFITTIGDTAPGTTMYEVRYEDDFGNVRVVDLPRPEIASFLYSRLPLIDEHNRQRQHFLDMSASWPTTDCWFRLITAVVGICVVDLMYLMRCSNKPAYEGLRVVKVADMVSMGLRLRDRHEALDFEGAPVLERHRDARGRVATKRRNGDGVNDRQTLPTQKSCWSCRVWYKNYVSTSYACPTCGQALCKVDRSKQDPTREISCYEEHLRDTNPATKCQIPRPAKRRKTEEDPRPEKPPWYGQAAASAEIAE